MKPFQGAALTILLFLAVPNSSGAPKENLLKRFYDKVDLNNDGAWEKREFKYVVLKYLEHFSYGFDASRDLDAYVEVLLTALSGQKMNQRVKWSDAARFVGTIQEASTKSFFHTLDVNRDGKLRPEEFQMVFAKKLGKIYGETKLPGSLDVVAASRMFFRVYDKPDGHQSLTLREFAKVLRLIANYRPR